MGDRIIGAVIIIIGLIIAGSGGTMSTAGSTIFYIVGFLVAFAGLGILVKSHRKASLANMDEK